MSAESDLINLGVCIKQQAERVGVEHEGVPLEGVVVRITNLAYGSEVNFETGSAAGFAAVIQDYALNYTRVPEETRTTRWPEVEEAYRQHVATIRAQTLREAANAWTQGAWADTPRKAERAADRLSAAQYAGDWLRQRAADIEGGKQ